jgi:hypothetical protein
MITTPEEKPDATDEQIEQKAMGALKLIEQFTLITDGEDEENIFLQGYHSGYRDRGKELKEREEQWISVETRLPDLYTDVLVFGKNGHMEVITTGFVNKEMAWREFGYKGTEITHWRKLPSPPKTVKDK